MKNSLRPSFLALAACLFGIAYANETVQPYRTLTIQPGSRIDTTNPLAFPNAIIDVPTPPVARPENPHFWQGETDPPNSLPVGGLFNGQRNQGRTNFPAIGFTGSVPPDPDLAVGPNHIVGVVNSDIAFFNKNGTKTFQQDSIQFFQGLGAGSFQFDPKVFWDRINRRFVIVFLELTGEVSKGLIAVSDDENPNGTWNRYRIEAGATIGGNTYWMDYPGWGYNKDAYVLSGNMFPNSTGGLGGVQFVVLPIQPMLNNQPVTASYVLFANGFTAQVAENWNTASSQIFAVSRSGNASMRTYAIDTSAGNTLQTTTVSVPQFSSPGSDVQGPNGTRYDSLDARLYQARLRGNSLVTAHCIGNQGSLAARWYEINLGSWPASGSPSLVQAGTVSSPNLQYHMPAVNMNSQGDITMIFNATSSSVAADLVIASRLRNDPLGSMGIPTTLERSTGNNYQGFRWGDYTDVDVDPVDDRTFWGIGMKVATNNTWTTSIHSWSVSAAGVADFTVAPNPLALGINGVGTVRLAEPQSGPTTVALTSNPSNLVNIPGSIVIPAGQTVGQFQISAKPIADSARVTVTANAGDLGSLSTNLTVTTIAVRQPLELWTNRIAGGNNFRGVVYLSAPAPSGGASVFLTSTNENIVTPERNWVVVPGGSNFVTVTWRTFPVTTTQTIYVRATRAGVTVENDIVVTPALLSGLSAPSSNIASGGTMIATVTLNGPAPSAGATVQLSSSNTAAATVPATVTIPAGSRTATFAIRARTVTAAQSTTIRATRLGDTRTLDVTVRP